MNAAPAALIADTPMPGITRLQALTADDMTRVNRAIREVLGAQADLIPKIGEHITASGGKRLRPMLALASAGLCGYRDGLDPLWLAAAVECIHTATLLHDDVVDESHLRRGVATANDVWGNKASVLVGDYIFTQATRFIIRVRSFEILDILSRTLEVIVDGEVLQLQHVQNVDAGEQAYLDIIDGKTAALFAAACEVGAVVSDAFAHRQPMRDYGRNLGLAFQMIDDALDYRASDPAFGKRVGNDFREGKATLPILRLYAALNESERRALRELFTAEASARGEEEFRRVAALMERHGALEQTLASARARAEEAKRGLEGFASSPWKQALLETVDFCVARSY